MRPNFSKFLGMMCLIMIALFTSTIEVEAQQTRPKIAQMELAPGQDYIILTDVNGTQTYVALDSAFIEHSVRNLTFEDDTLCFEVYNAFLDELIDTECVFVPTTSLPALWTVFEIDPIDGGGEYIISSAYLFENQNEANISIYLNGIRLTEDIDYTVAYSGGNAVITMSGTYSDYSATVVYRTQ